MMMFTYSVNDGCDYDDVYGNGVDCVIVMIMMMVMVMALAVRWW